MIIEELTNKTKTGNEKVVNTANETTVVSENNTEVESETADKSKKRGLFGRK